MSLLAFSLGVVPLSLALLLYKAYSGTYKTFQWFQSSVFDNTPEIHDPISLSSVNGNIPEWLNGIMYRIGPGIFHIDRQDGSVLSIHHAFDGLPFMHRLEISGKNQSVKYNSRMLVESLASDIKQNKNNILVFFGHCFNLSFFDWLVRLLMRIDKYILRKTVPSKNKPDSQSVGVTATPNFPLPSRLDTSDKNSRVLVAKTDANVLQKINSETLVPEALFSYGDYESSLTEEFSAAHHQFDPKTKETFNFTLTFAPFPRLKVFSISNSGKVTVLADITHRNTGDRSRIRAAYIHSFWITENYIVIPEAPLYYKNKGLNVLLHGAAISSMKWDGNEPTYFHVISRYPEKAPVNTPLASIPFPSFFQFHTANAFESKNADGHTILTLDCASFSNGNILYQVHDYGLPREKCVSKKNGLSTYSDGFETPPSIQTSFADLCRYKLNLDLKKVYEKTVLSENTEFPRFNQDHMLQDYTYVYGCQLNPGSDKKKGNTGIIKVNVKEKTSIRYHEDGFLCSEPIFVKRPDGVMEDDGVLLTLANGEECCYLIILNAADLNEVSRFKIGAFTTTTFHGSYVDHDFKAVNIN